MTDQDFLRRAAEVGNRKPAPYNFGAVVVKDGLVIGESESDVDGLIDPAAHSEVMALRKAAKHLGSWQTPGVTLYCSHEPCMMCFSCALWAGVDRVVYAISKEEQHDFTYEFKDISLRDLAEHASRSIVIEHIPVENNP